MMIILKIMMMWRDSEFAKYSLYKNVQIYLTNLRSMRTRLNRIILHVINSLQLFNDLSWILPLQHRCSHDLPLFLVLLQLSLPRLLPLLICGVHELTTFSGGGGATHLQYLTYLESMLQLIQDFNYRLDLYRDKYISFISHCRNHQFNTHQRLVIHQVQFTKANPRKLRQLLSLDSLLLHPDAHSQLDAR